MDSGRRLRGVARSSPTQYHFVATNRDKEMTDSVGETSSEAAQVHSNPQSSVKLAKMFKSRS